MEMGNERKYNKDCDDFLLTLKKDIAGTKEENKSLLSKYEDLARRYQNLELANKQIRDDNKQIRDDNRTLSFHYLELKVQLNDFIEKQGLNPLETATKTSRPAKNICQENEATNKDIDSVCNTAKQRDTKDLHHFCFEDEPRLAMKLSDTNDDLEQSGRKACFHSICHLLKL